MNFKSVINLKTIGIVSFAIVLALTMFMTGQGGMVYAVETVTSNSKASVLMEYGTGEVLAEYNSTEQLPIASVTKLMTILLTMESIEKGDLSLDQIIITSENASGMGGSQVFIDANAEYKVSNLLKAVIVASANDASVALAEEIGGSEEGFVQMMNNRATELGLENTNYVNCSGLPAPSQYSCAKDVAKVMRELIDYPLYFEYSRIWMEDFQHPSGRVTGMANTNKLVKFYKGCDAGKTGSTSEAGYCLSATAERNNMRLISVVLGAETSKERFADASAQFDWGFKNFESVRLVNATENLADKVELQKAKNNNLVLVPEEDFWSVTKRGDTTNLEVNIDLPSRLSAPLEAGDVVGKILLTEQGEVKKEINIIVAENVEQQGYFGTTKTILTRWYF